MKNIQPGYHHSFNNFVHSTVRFVPGIKVIFDPHKSGAFLGDLNGLDSWSV